MFFKINFNKSTDLLLPPIYYFFEEKSGPDYYAVCSLPVIFLSRLLVLWGLHCLNCAIVGGFLRVLIPATSWKIRILTEKALRLRSHTNPAIHCSLCRYKGCWADFIHFGDLIGLIWVRDCLIDFAWFFVPWRCFDSRSVFFPGWRFRYRSPAI